MQNIYPDYQGYPVNQSYPDNQGYPGIQGYPGYQGNQVCPGYQANYPAAFENLPYDYSPAAGQYCNEGLVRIIQECEATCEYATTHLRSRSDIRGRRNQLILLRDCADICGTTAKFVARCSDYDRQNALVCANICECCAKECARFNDRISQHCAQICCYCAKACRIFAQGY